MSPPLLFSGGPVFGHPANTAVLTDGPRIAAVGAAPEVERGAPAGTERVDLEGRLLVPGFQDAHVHPVMGGLQRLRCSLEPARDLEQGLEIVRSYANNLGSGAWVRGGGWHYSWFAGGNPSAELLDRITQQPAYLVVADGHSGWANTAALRVAGIDALTPDPSDGVIVRHRDGSPQGTLHEGAMDLVERVLPEETPADIDAALLASQDYLLSLGITAWQDAWVTDPIDAAYRRLATSGALRCRVRGALWWDRDRGLEQLDEIVERSRQPIEPYVPGTVKLMLDGVAENHTASMLAPYLNDSGRSTGNRGLDFIDPVELRHIVTAIDAAGLQCHFHALGDRAVRNALDAMEAAEAANGSRDRRAHLAHIQVIDPSDVPRFAQLGAVANMQPLWACLEDAMTELTIPFLPEDRVRFQYPFGSLRAAGARLAMGSDWSVSTPDVMQQIGVAVTRTRPAHGVNDPFLPEERLTVEESLLAATKGSAYVNFFDGDSGTIAVGTRADLAVLSGDPHVDSPHDLSVDLTVLAGERVAGSP